MRLKMAHRPHCEPLKEVAFGVAVKGEPKTVERRARPEAVVHLGTSA